MIRRFSISANREADLYEEHDINGDWVLYEDHAVELAELRKDKELLDFLASPSNRIANVQLPTESVDRHPHDMRSAIRDAMGMNDEHNL